MTTIREDNLTTLLYLNVIIFDKSLFGRLVVLEHIHEANLVSKSDYDLKTRGVESYTESFILVLFIDL